jgi:hypothetical protein
VAYNTSLRERGREEPVRTKGQKLRYSRYSIMPGKKNASEREELGRKKLKKIGRR